MVNKLAFIISRAFGPLPLLCLLWLVTAVKSGIGFWRAIWVYPLIFIVGIAIPFTITSYLIFKGSVKGFDWSDLRDRKIAILIVMAFWVIDFFLIKFLTNATVYHLSLLTAGITGVYIFITLVLKFKISLHTGIASGVFWGVNFMTHFASWWLFLLLVPIVWARATLKVHTFSELISSLILANALIALAVLIFGLPAIP